MKKYQVEINGKLVILDENEIISLAKNLIKKVNPIGKVKALNQALFIVACNYTINKVEEVKTNE